MEQGPAIRWGFFAEAPKASEHRDIFQQRNHAEDDHHDACDLLGAAVERQQVDQVQDQNDDEKRDEYADQHLKIPLKPLDANERFANAWPGLPVPGRGTRPPAITAAAQKITQWADRHPEEPRRCAASRRTTARLEL